MPLTRRSHANAMVNSSSKEKNVDMSSAAKNLKKKKRTIETIEDQSPSTPTAQGTGNQQDMSKKTRMTGPSRGRPLQLEFASDAEEEEQFQGSLIDNKASDKASKLHPSGQAVIPRFSTHAHSDIEDFSDSNYGDTEVESEEEWLSVPQPLEPGATNTSKTPHTLAVERPVWKDTTVPASAKPGKVANPASQDPSAVAENKDLSLWPIETNLTFVEGSNRVMLTAQSPIIRGVIQDAIERTRASVMFLNAFPNLFETLENVGEALVLAAEHNEKATDIHRRLLSDHMYSVNMARIPRARIPLFRREVKDCCAAIVQAEFVAIPSNMGVIQLAEKQLENYNYTFPRAGNRDPRNFLPRRTRPYRNIRIINVIRDIFFTGGNSSFANRFRSKFSIHQGSDGVMSREVPIAMVALVATALYVAIKEWESGTYKFIEFSANAYHDVYDGHVNTFNHIFQNREDAFHLMMSDIYSQAISAKIGFSLPMADIELDALDDGEE